MIRFSMSNLALTMSIRVSAKEIGKIIDRLDIQPSGNLAAFSPESVHVAAIQLMGKKYASLTDYIVDMNLYVADAVNRRAQLIVFPMFTGLLPFSFVPQYDEAIEKIQPEPEAGFPNPKALSDTLAYYLDFLYEAYYNTMSILAARHQVCIMAGTTLCFEEKELRHRAFLFGPDGDLIGYQDKLSLDSLEQRLGIEAESELKCFETPAGPVSILIGSDVDYYETARVSAKLGASIILHPTLFTREYTPVDAAGGLNLRVQENNLYGIQSVLVGDSGFGFMLEGPACIFAPNPMVKNKNGILLQSSGRFAPDIISRALNIEMLAGMESPYTEDRNPSLMEKYVDRLY